MRRSYSTLGIFTAIMGVLSCLPIVSAINTQQRNLRPLVAARILSERRTLARFFITMMLT
jgi:hypothetical protein